MAAAFDVSEVVEAAARLQATADNVDSTLEESFAGWVEDVTEHMVAEIPEIEGTMRESVTIERDGLTATIGPTNVDEQGRPIGFFVNYGAGNRPPNDFIGRTAVYADETVGGLDVSDVL